MFIQNPAFSPSPHCGHCSISRRLTRLLAESPLPLIRTERRSLATFTIGELPSQGWYPSRCPLTHHQGSHAVASLSQYNEPPPKRLLADAPSLQEGLLTTRSSHLMATTRSTFPDSARSLLTLDVKVSDLFNTE